MVIHKYKLEIADDQLLDLPADHRPLSVQVQNGEICMWAAVTPDAPTSTLMVFMRGTGQQLEPMPARAIFLGTVQLLDGGALAFHVFVCPYPL